MRLQVDSQKRQRAIYRVRSSRRSRFCGFVAVSRPGSRFKQSPRGILPVEVSLGRSLISRSLSDVESWFTILRSGCKASSRHLRAQIGDPAALIGLNRAESLSLMRTEDRERPAEASWPNPRVEFPEKCERREKRRHEYRYLST